MAILTTLTVEIRNAEPSGVVICDDCHDEIGLGNLFTRDLKNGQRKQRPVCAECYANRLRRRVEDLETRARQERTFLRAVEKEIEARPY